MKRRDFIGLIGSASLTWPLAARAQQLPTIGLLGANSSSTQRQLTEAFVQRLRERGWIEGSTVAIEFRWADGRGERYDEIAAEFSRMKVAVIVTSGGSAVMAAKRSISEIPIVFAAAGDPVASGLVASLARGNVTGLSIQSPETAGKRLELLREVVPVSDDWRSWSMLTVLLPTQRLLELKPRPERWELRSTSSKSGEPRISPLCLRVSKATWVHCMLWRSH